MTKPILDEPTLDTSHLDPNDPANAAPAVVRAAAASAVLGKALDYSQGIPSGHAVHAAGYPAVIRYLKKRGSSSVKVLTSASYSDKTANGVAVGLVYEDTSPSRAGQGRAAGETDGAWALTQAKACGIVTPRCIYFAVDYDADPNAVIAYFQGTLAAVGKAVNGAYGSKKVIDALFAAGLISWGWQTQAWSGGAVTDHLNIYQRIGTVVVDGVGCDVSEIHTADFGQHPAPAQPVPDPPEDDVTAADLATIKGYVERAVDEIRTETSEGNSIANVVQHQKAQGNELVAVKAELDAMKKTLATILAAVQK